jgi:hypothetical protein
MIKKSTIPTILGIVVLIIGIATGVLLIESRRVFKLGATPEVTPKNVRITNISDSSFTVFWTTDKETKGFIQWGERVSVLGKIATDSIKVASSTHSVTLGALAPLTPYYFKINSDGTDFDNSGIPWQVKTGPRLATPPVGSVIFGTVLTPAGLPATNSLVYVTVGGSSPLSTITQDNGSWILPISASRDQSLASYIIINETSTLVEISVQAGPAGVASAQIYPASSRPVPPITLGQVHDYKNLPPGKPGEVPKASVGLPEDTERPSGFQVDDVTPTPSEKTVTLENVQEGELLTSTTPEFSGEGPAGVILTITIESEPITEQITIDNSGSWRLRLAEELGEGIHKITISWRDASGILRTLSRNFTVQAVTPPTATPTPSPTATPRLTPTPTATATPTPTPTPTKIATQAAIPDAGTLTATLLLFVMGLGSLVFGGLLAAFSFRSK